MMSPQPGAGSTLLDTSETRFGDLARKHLRRRRAFSVKQRKPPEVGPDRECRSRLRQDSELFFRNRIRTRSQQFGKNRSRIRSYFKISAVAEVCVVSKNMGKLRLD